MLLTKLLTMLNYYNFSIEQTRLLHLNALDYNLSIIYNGNKKKYQFHQTYPYGQLNRKIIPILENNPD